jgi:hypothetical protein
MVRQAHHERKNFDWLTMSGSNFRARSFDKLRTGSEFVEGCAQFKSLQTATVQTFKKRGKGDTNLFFLVFTPLDTTLRTGISP